MKIYYYSDPDKITEDHIGNYFDMTLYSYKEFNNVDKALAFFNECTRPLSQLSDIIKNESIKDADFTLRHKRLGYTELIDNYFNN